MHGWEILIKCDMLLSSVEFLIFFTAYKTVSDKNIPIANFQLELIKQLLEKYRKYNNSPNNGRARYKE